METAFYGNPGASRFKKGFFVLSCRIARIATFFFKGGERRGRGFTIIICFFLLFIPF